MQLAQFFLCVFAECVNFCNVVKRKASYMPYVSYNVSQASLVCARIYLILPIYAAVSIFFKLSVRQKEICISFAPQISRLTPVSLDQARKNKTNISAMSVAFGNSCRAIPAWEHMQDALPCKFNLRYTRIVQNRILLHTCVLTTSVFSRQVCSHDKYVRAMCSCAQVLCAKILRAGGWWTLRSFTKITLSTKQLVAIWCVAWSLH
jgi:hypothetical protein